MKATTRSLSGRSWRMQPGDPEAGRALAATLGAPPVLGLLLLNRGITETAAARDFLAPALEQLHDPFLLPDIEPAVDRIARAIGVGELILIHGDYDVDGVTATALLARGLVALGGRVQPHVPHRRRDGYDLQTPAVDAAHSKGATLILTADCGTLAVEAVAAARAHGLDVIITDHHEPGVELPPALAVINPRRHDSTYPFPHLCGCGIALKLVQAVAGRLGHDGLRALRAFLDLAALATAADQSPLCGENRVIVRLGLDGFPRTRKEGLRALLQSAGIDAGRPLRAWDLQFLLAPRLNAMGRMDESSVALDLLLTCDPAEARTIAGRMEVVNQERRAEQERVVKAAHEQVEELKLAQEAVVVVSGADWNPGVVGIVAAKLAETYHRPAIVIAGPTRSAPGAEGCRGSARTHGAFPLMRLLDGCRDLMERCGGHQAAAGFDVAADRVEALRDRLELSARDLLSTEESEGVLDVDAALPAADLGLDLLHQISALQPHGQGNAEPLFMSPLTVVDRRAIGRESAHLKLIVRGQGLPPTEALLWSRAHLFPRFAPGSNWEVCYRVEANLYSGRETLQLRVEDARPEDK